MGIVSAGPAENTTLSKPVENALARARAKSTAAWTKTRLAGVLRGLPQKRASVCLQSMSSRTRASQAWCFGPSAMRSVKANITPEITNTKWMPTFQASWVLS